MADGRKRKRGDGPRMVTITVSVPPATREAIRRAAIADGVADGALARAALERGLLHEIDARRKRRARDAERAGPEDA
ncbi:MAG: hypothetical protein OXH64_07985 [Rhodospirillaceae bacterium]|nr:hypothetical protein [Rhodospirillaceae bacterium]